MELVKVDGASAIRQTAQGHHPRRTSFTQQRQESAGEREMSEVVGTKLQFEPIGGDMAGGGGGKGRPVDLWGGLVVPHPQTGGGRVNRRPAGGLAVFGPPPAPWGGGPACVWVPLCP